MKNVLSLIFMVIFLAATAKADDPNGPELTFEKERHDYGTMYVDSMPDTKIDVKFTNTGNEPLIISRVRACCGTRVREWPEEPIAPGEEGVIKVEFRLAPRPQRISRTVTVNYNHAERPTVVYRIVGRIEQRD